MPKKITVIIGIIVVGAIVAGAVYINSVQLPGVPGKAMEAVPQGVEIVGIANWERIVNDRDVQSLIDEYLDAMGERVTFDDLYDDFNDEIEDELGIDIDKISQGVFFANEETMCSGFDYSRSGGPDYFGVILEGDFDKDEIIDKLEENDDIDEKTRKGVDVYIANGEDIAFAEMDNLLVLGTKRAVFDSIDAKKEGERLKGELKSVFNSARGNYIEVAAEIPREFREQMEEVSAEVLGDISAFSEIEYVAYGLNKADGKFSEHVNIRTSDKSDAKDIADAIEGVVKMYKNELPRDIKNVLKEVEITQSGTAVKIDSVVTIEEIEDAVGAIEEL